MVSRDLNITEGIPRGCDVAPTESRPVDDALFRRQRDLEHFLEF
jgi:hypothetical protein